ncbi:MAG: DNRLRE domain-containing protein, partial [Woeseiaceae bacterium]
MKIGQNVVHALVAVLVVLSLTLGVQRAVANTLQLTDDSFVNFGQPASNKGDQLELSVRDTSNERRGFAKFDLSGIPSSVVAADIDSATLRLWVKDVINAGGQVDLYLVEGHWDEETLTPELVPPVAATPFA